MTIEIDLLSAVLYIILVLVGFAIGMKIKSKQRKSVFHDWLEKSQIIISGKIEVSGADASFNNFRVNKAQYSNEEVDLFLSCVLARHIMETSGSEEESYRRMMAVETAMTNPQFKSRLGSSF